MIPGGVTGDFFRGTPDGTMALRSTQPLEVSTRDFSWGKGDRSIWLKTHHPCSAETSRKSGALSYPQNPLRQLDLLQKTFTLLYTATWRCLVLPFSLFYALLEMGTLYNVRNIIFRC